MNPISRWWQRRKARKADAEILEHVRLTDWFFGPMDAEGKRPIDALDITVGEIDVSQITASGTNA